MVLVGEGFVQAGGVVNKAFGKEASEERTFLEEGGLRGVLMDSCLGLG